MPSLQPLQPAPAPAADLAQERADVIAIAGAILALHSAGPAIARLMAPTDWLLATGFASHLAEILSSNAAPADMDHAYQAHTAEFTDAVVTAAEVLRADGSTVPAP